MKHCLVTLAALLVAASSFAQGTVQFNNRIPPAVDARVFYANGGTPTAAGDAFMANLYVVNGGTYSLVQNSDGTPSTAFKFYPSPDAAKGYLNVKGVDTTRVVPGAASTANLAVRAWATELGGSYEEALGKNRGGVGESPVLNNVGLGGGLNPPGSLTGLQGFTVSTVQAIPEPAIAALGLLGAGLLVIRRKK